MTASVESRIVTMKFDNKAFMANATATLGVLKKLGEAAILPGATKGLAAVQAAAGKFNLGNAGAHVDGFSQKWVALSAVVATAMSNITSSVAASIANVAREMSGLEAMKAGFDEYELKLGSIQSILANTKGESLETVNAALEQLNKYSDKTIYNFGEMVSNIKAFTVAGVDLDRSVASVKGLANVAALTGTNSQDAARATYQMAQAMSSGTVRLQDWISMEHAGGMAGRVFQDSLIRTAKVHGVNVDEMIKKNGSFRLSLQEDWLTADILNETLGQFAGAYERADLARMGYTETQIKAILKMQKEAEAAATDVKTFSALVSTLKESMGSGWAKTWEVLFGNLKESTKLWTSVNNVIGGAIQKSADARNAMLSDWKKMGGRTVAIEGIANIFKALFNVLKPIQQAFRDIFPPTTAKNLYAMTVAFRDFTERLIAGEGTMENIRSIFRAIFAVIDLGLTVVRGIVKYFFTFFGLIDDGAGGALDLAAAIADIVTSLHAWLDEGGKITDFFDALIEGREKALGPIFDVLGAILSVVADLVRMGANVSFDFLKGLNLDMPSLDGFGDLFSGLADDIREIDVELEGFGGTVDKVFGALKDAIESVDLPGFFDIGDATSVAEVGVDGVNKSLEETPSVLDKIGAGFKAFFDMFGGFDDIVARARDSISGFFGRLQDLISAGAKDLTFTDVLAIINTGFLIALYRTIKKWSDQLGAVLESASGVLDQVKDNLKTMQTEVKANIIMKIAIAVGILAASVFLLSKVPVDKAGIALGAIAAMMTMMVIALKVLSKNLIDDPRKALAASANLIALSVAMVGMSVAMAAMAGAVAILGNMDIGTLAKGLGAVVVIMAALTGMSAVLAKTGGAVAMVMAAAALTVLSVALIGLSKALEIYGKMDWKTLLSGTAKISVALVSLSIAMALMSAALPGAIALTIISAALTILAGSLALFAQLDWGTLLKALGMVAVSVGVFAALGALSPLVLALGAALLLLGVAMLAAGTGMALFATAIALLATAGPAGFAVLSAAIFSFLEMLPIMVEQFGLTLLALAKVIGKYGPPLVSAMAKVLGRVLEAMVVLTPKFGKVAEVFLREMMRVVRALTPDVVRTGFALLIAFLNELLRNVPKISEVSSQLIITFLRELGDRLPRIVDAGFKFVIKFLHGLARAIRENRSKLMAAGFDLADAIIDGIIQGIEDLAGAALEAVKDLGGDLVDAGLGAVGIGGPAKEFIPMGEGIPMGLAVGVKRKEKVATDQIDKMGKNAMDTLRVAMKGIDDSMNQNMDFDPRIRPVLDLSQLEKDMPKVGNMLNEPFKGKMNSSFSKHRAADISQMELDSHKNRDLQNETGKGKKEKKEVKFEQNNYSPKALSPTEIYRNTRNQLALAKAIFEEEDDD
jgi:tape measure domain-containing protein